MIEYLLPAPGQWNDIIARPVMDRLSLQKKIQPILEAVRTGGDRALRLFTEEFDKVRLAGIRVSQEEINAAVTSVDETLQTAIQTAAANIRKFHASALRTSEAIETMPGVVCWQRRTGIARVGLYIPGGSAPLFSTVLMLGIPAQLAGCDEIILCSPPQPDGRLHPAILYAAQIAGISKIFRVGGAQAIAAMAYGTESIPKTDKIFGPGNQYVTCAKQLVNAEGTAIDMPAGPSEVAILADASAHPAFVAADLLSQAEHGPDSQVLLITDDKNMLINTKLQLEKQMSLLPRGAIAQKALENSKAVLVNNLEEGIELVNAYAPEHLIINCADAAALAAEVRHAGSVFLGPWSPESAGDYASGTNHTLPTNGYARMYSGVSVESFSKTITYQQLTKAGLEQLGSTIIAMAKAEGLEAHALAVSIRLEEKSTDPKN